ncbi:MAG: hypothetical protein FGF53_05135 [Candidatus Brockarchaeota archaeon]|nr:hypothetical protein [Candidatus Brockarchaeota archaeon]MBO3809768.1 hypothetical protein [Candidatus Brockarchaeota archaeon]
MSKLTLAWLMPVSRRIDALISREITKFYKDASEKGLIDGEESEAQLEKALSHKTDFVTALKISVPVNWRSSVSYRLWKSEGSASGFTTMLKTMRDRRMYDLATTFAIALKSGDIRDEAFDEKDFVKPEEYEFKIRIADNLESLVNKRVREIHREGFAERYFKGREEVFNYEFKDLKYSELFRKGEYDKILSLYEDLKETWHGKTAGIGERVVSLTLFEAGMLDEEPDACEAIVKYQWAITNIWMWSDEMKDLFSNLKESSINMLIVECLKNGLRRVDEQSVKDFIARNPSILDEPVKEYFQLARSIEDEMRRHPWINMMDYSEGAKIVFKKFEERKRSLLKAIGVGKA